ncbi:hypothetical protein [Nocardia nova]|uniref:hypothetical protein n=1 Tax=Nocardia nova TaxID=37330 RepID=UPI00340BEF9D
MTAGISGGTVRQQLPDWVCDLPGGASAVCDLDHLGKKAVGSAASSAFDGIVDRLVDAMSWLIRAALTWWVHLPAPQLVGPSGEPGPMLATIRGYTSGLQVLLMIAGILFAAARLAMAKRGGVAGEAQETFLIFARAVFASMMIAALITTGTKAGDAFSNWVINEAAAGDFHGAVDRLVNVNLHGNGLGSGVLFIIAILGAISMLIQLVMLVIRQAVLILVVAAIPLAAAAAGTGPGSQAYKRMISWALAFVLWKPVGALVYAIAFTAAGSRSPDQQSDPQLVLLGMILLLSVTIVLPALMRMVAPAVATLGGGGGTGAALAGGAIGMAMGAAGGSGGGGGDQSSARKVTEGENASSSGGGGNGPPPPPPPPPGGGAGGRPLSGGGGEAGTSSGGGSSAGAGAQASGGAAAGGATAAAAGPAGAVLAGAQAVGKGVNAVGGAVESQTGADVDAAGPGEVRR